MAEKIKLQPSKVSKHYCFNCDCGETLNFGFYEFINNEVIDVICRCGKDWRVSSITLDAELIGIADERDEDGKNIDP